VSSLHNQEVRRLRGSLLIVRIVRLGWGDQKCIENFGGDSLGRPRKMCEGNGKMDLKEMVYEDGKWVKLAQDYVQWRTLILAMLKLGVLLPGSW